MVFSFASFLFYERNSLYLFCLIFGKKRHKQNIKKTQAKRKKDTS